MLCASCVFVDCLVTCQRRLSLDCVVRVVSALVCVLICLLCVNCRLCVCGFVVGTLLFVCHVFDGYVRVVDGWFG